MRVLLLTQFFDPEPTIKGLPFARELARRGHDVEVLTGFPNYPGGKLYPGHRLRAFRRELVDGVRVNRVWLYPSHDRSAVRRVGNYASFALSAAALGLAVTRRPDVVYAYHPPGTIGVPAIALAARWRVPFVLDIQDLWPDTIAATGMLSSPGILRTLGAYCRFVYDRATQITVLSPGFREALVERGVPAEKVTVIPNWSDERALSAGADAPSPRAALGLEGRFVVLFAGTMGVGQALDPVLEAAARCLTRVPEAAFVFIGGGTERDRLERVATERGLANVRFLPRVPMEAMGPYLAMADGLLVHLRDDPLFRITIPSKTQAYMAAGRPILMGVRGDAAHLVREAGAGLVFDPESPDALTEAVAALAALSPEAREAMGAAGRDYYRRKLSLSAGVDAFEEVFTRARDAARHPSGALDAPLTRR